MLENRLMTGERSRDFALIRFECRSYSVHVRRPPQFCWLLGIVLAGSRNGTFSADNSRSSCRAAGGKAFAIGIAEAGAGLAGEAAQIRPGRYAFPVTCSCSIQSHSVSKPLVSIQ